MLRNRQLRFDGENAIMKDMLKYVLIGIGVVLLQWAFVVLFIPFFNGMSGEVAAVLGVGFFLAFEIVICTGLVISKMRK